MAKKFAPIKKMKNGGVFSSLKDSIGGLKTGVNDTLKNTFDTSLSEVGSEVGKMGMDAAKVGLDYGLAPISAPVAALTGKSLTDNLGWDYQSKAGQAVGDPLSKAYTGVTSAAAPMVANAIAPGSGALVASAQGMTRGLMKETDGIQAMGMGGMAKKQLINVEKNELEVDPHTGKVIKDFKDKPNHPENDDMINLKGNTHAKMGDVIIPKNMREKYLSSSPMEKKMIINSLINRTNTTNTTNRMEEGGFPVILPPSNKPLYDIPKGEIVNGVDTGMVDRTEAIIRPTQTKLWQIRNQIDSSTYKPSVDSQGNQIPGVVPDNVSLPMKKYVIPNMQNFQRVLTAELQRKAGAGNQITTQSLTPEEAQKVLTDAGAGSYKDYIDNFNTYQTYRDKFNASHNKKSVSGSKDPSNERYGIRHAQLFTPQNVVPVTNNTPPSRKKGGLVSLKDCGMSKRYGGEDGSVVEPDLVAEPGTETAAAGERSYLDTPPTDFSSLAPLGSNLGTIGMGLYQNFQAKKGLKSLGQTPVPNYTVSPEMKKGYETAISKANLAADAAKSRAGYGFNTAQTAQYKQNLAQQNNTAYQNAVSRSGGNLAQAINAAINSQNIAGQNQFAVNDANLQNQKLGQANSLEQYANSMGINAGNAFQGQQNLATAQDIQRRMEKERALGLAKSQGMTNLASGMNSLGSQVGTLAKLAG